MSRLLLLAFEAFGPWRENSTGQVTAEASRLLEAEGVEVARFVLPVALARAPQALIEHFDTVRPDAVVATGLAGRRDHVDVERLGINLAEFRIPDNDGAQPLGQPLDSQAPDAFLTTADVHAVVAAIQATGAPARVSHDAGTYLCNAVYFHSLRLCRPAGLPALFLHLPPLPDAARELGARVPLEVDPHAGLELELQVAAVAAACRVLLA